MKFSTYALIDFYLVRHLLYLTGTNNNSNLNLIFAFPPINAVEFCYKYKSTVDHFWLCAKVCDFTNVIALHQAETVGTFLITNFVNFFWQLCKYSIANPKLQETKRLIPNICLIIVNLDPKGWDSSFG